ncbi:MAG: Ig-like domain-containing protein [Prevotella sp.]|nr:Ig-like domain-containing protein [Prevotella sp.]
MNKKLRYSLLMLLLAVFSTGWAEDSFEWDLTVASYSSQSADQVVWESDYATMTADKANAGTNANNYLGGDAGGHTSSRVYKGSTLTIAPESGVEIISVVFSATSTNYASALGTSTWSNATATVSDKTVTVTPTDGTEPMVATIGGTAGFTSVVVNYEVVTSGKTPIATNVSFSPVEVDADSQGEFTLSADFADGASYSLTWASDNEDVIEVDNDGAYQANDAGTANVTVTITPDDTDNYKEVSKKLTVTVKAGTLANIAALTAQTVAGSYDVTLDNAIVTYTNGNYAYIQDASGAVVMYKNGHGLTAGQVLNGTATVTYQVRNGNPQITALSGVTPEAGTTTPEPTVVAPEDFPQIASVLSQWFKVTGATITKSGNKYYMDLNGQNVQLYGQGAAQNFSLTNLEGVTYTVIGFPTIYNTTLELQIFEVPEMEAGELPFVGTINGLSPLEVTVGDEGDFTLDFDPYNGLIEDADYYVSYITSNADVLWYPTYGLHYSADAPGTVTVTVTVTPTDDESYLPVSEQFTVTVKAGTLENIAALTAQTNAGTYDVVLDNAVVTYVNGNYAYIQDESGAVVMYKSGHGLTAGQVLNGTATVTYQLRNQNPQITDLSGVTPEAGTTIPEPTEVAADQFPVISEVLSQWFTVPEVTITEENGKYYVDLNGQNVQLYGQGDARNFALSDLDVTYSVTGFPTLYNSTLELQIFEVPEAVGVLPDLVTEVTLSPTELTVGDNGSFELNYTVNEQAGNDPLITFVSSDPSVLEVNSDGSAYEALAEGPVTVTVTLEPQEDDAEAFNPVTVEFEVTVSAAPEPEGITYYKKITSTDDLTTGRYLIVYEPENVAFDGSLDNLDVDHNTQPVTISADNIIATDQAMYFTINTTDGSITSASGHTIGVTTYGNALKMDRANFPPHSFAFDDNGNVLMSLEIYDGETLKGTMILNFNSNKSDKRFRYYKEGSQKQIQLYKEYEDVPVEVTVTVGQRGAVSFSSAYPLDFSDADVQAFIVTQKNGNYFNKVQVTEIPANTGVVVEGAEGEYAVKVATETMPEAPEGNLLVATSTGAYTVEEADYGRAYGLFYSTAKQAVGFKKMALGKTTDVDKCYLLLPEADGANEIFFDFTDGIDTVETTAPAFEGDAYNLNGQKVNASYKGVIIVNGKKVINR